MVEQLPRLPATARLSPLVLRLLGGNPGKFTLQGTNTYLVGSGARRILIDTGEGNRIWPGTLKEALAAEAGTNKSGGEGIVIEKVLLTHWHPDHVGGVGDVRALFPGVKVFKNRTTHSSSSSSSSSGEDEEIVDGQVFKVEGATLRAFHCPGHAADHMAFVLEEEGAMFTGDNVLGHGTAVFEDLAAYMTSLERMRGQFQGRGYPGHGAVLEDGRAKIGEYISHRRGREEEILGVLRKGKPGQGGEEGGWSSMGIVRVVYKAYPESLHGPAEGGVVQVLRKLEGEGRVEQVGEGGWRMAQKSAL